MIKKIIFLSFIFNISLFSQTISYEQIVKKAFDYNIGLQIINTDKDITQATIEEIDSLYYPTVSVEVNTQYRKNLEEGIVANDDITQYESSVNFRVDYDLYDFGVKNKKKSIAVLDKELVNYDILENKQELKLKLLELYSKVLTAKNEIYYYQNIQILNDKIYTLKKRLYESKQIDKLTLATQAITIVELNKKLQDISSTIKDSLIQISFYTNVSYTTDTIFKPLNIATCKDISYKENFIYKRLNTQIKQKQQTIKLLKDEQYSIVKFFSTYNFYNEDDTDLADSLRFKEQNYVVGINFNITLFNGYKYSATHKKLKAELLKLKLQQKEQEEIYTNQKTVTKQDLTNIQQNINNIENSITKHQIKENIITRLDKAKNIDTITMLENKKENITKTLELDISFIEEISKLKQMEILGIKTDKQNVKKTII